MKGPCPVCNAPPPCLCREYPTGRDAMLQLRNLLVDVAHAAVFMREAAKREMDEGKRHSAAIFNISANRVETALSNNSYFMRSLFGTRDPRAIAKQKGMHWSEWDRLEEENRP